MIATLRIRSGGGEASPGTGFSAGWGVVFDGEAGAVAAGRRRRVYDAVIFKVLGATRSVILKAFLLEYGILGVSTGVISALIGSLTAWAVIVWLMDMHWVFIPEAVGVTLSVCIVLTLIVGFTGTWRALGQKAAPLLRNE